VTFALSSTSSTADEKRRANEFARAALEQARGDIDAAAECAGVARATFYRWTLLSVDLKVYGVRLRHAEKKRRRDFDAKLDDEKKTTGNLRTDLRNHNLLHPLPPCVAEFPVEIFSPKTLRLAC